MNFREEQGMGMIYIYHIFTHTIFFVIYKVFFFKYSFCYPTIFKSTVEYSIFLFSFAANDFGSVSKSSKCG